MSIDAMSYVFKHSPYKGAARCVHLAIADVVNDTMDWVFWASQEKVAVKANCTRQAANMAIKKMVKDGYLEVIERQTGRKQTCRFKFIFKSASTVALSESESASPVALSGESASTDDTLGPESATTVDTNSSTTNSTTNETQETLALQLEDEKPTSEVQQVWNAYLATLERCGFPTKRTLDAKRQRLIVARLKEFSVDELTYAIAGLEFSSFHRGDNDSGKRYDALELIIRNAQKIEQFSAYHEKTRTAEQKRNHVNDSWTEDRGIKRARVIGSDDPF